MGGPMGKFWGARKVGEMLLVAWRRGIVPGGMATSGPVAIHGVDGLVLGSGAIHGVDGMVLGGGRSKERGVIE